ncbi:MAG: hypothetical protein PHF81_04605 [Flavobacterium sp.]|nr:hypothetical protein [Flavobacterium sp.]
MVICLDWTRCKRFIQFTQVNRYSLQTSTSGDTLEKIEQRVHYIHYNPVEAEIVFHERDYVNSSYRNYEEDNTVFCNVNVEPLW